MENFDNGLASLSSGSLVFATVHLVSLPTGESILCKPSVPARRLVPRPDVSEPTCGRCKAAQASRIRRGVAG